MHKIIRIICYGKDDEEAMSNAEGIMENIVEKVVTG